MTRTHGEPESFSPFADKPQKIPRKQAVAAARESEERFAITFARNAAIMSLIRLEDDVYLEVNDAWMNVFGFDRDDVLGKTPIQLNIWPDAATRDAIYKTLRENGSIRDAEFTLRRASGELCVLLLSAEIITMAGEPVLLSNALDITERKRIEEELRRELDAMTQLQKLGLMSVQGGDLEPILTEVVDTAIAISGSEFGNIQLLNPDSGDLQIVAQRGFPAWWIEFWDSATKGHGVCGTAMALGQRVIVEDVEQSQIFIGTPALDIQRKAGVRAVQSTPLVSRSGKMVGIFSTHYGMPTCPDRHTQRLLDLLARQAADIIEHVQAKDELKKYREHLEELVHERTGDLETEIIERKRVEETAVAAQSFLDKVVDMSPFAMWISDKDGMVIRTNHSLRQTINLADDAIRGKYNVFQDKNLEQQGVMPLVKAVFEQHQPARFTIPWQAALVNNVDFMGGRNMVIDAAMFPILNAQNELTNVVCQWVDITEQKLAEQNLKESEERLALVLEGSQLGYWDWNIKTGEVQRNEQWAKMLGYTLPEIELNVRQWTDLHHPDDKAAAWKSIQDHLDGRTPAHRIEYRMRCKNGEYKWILDQARVVEWDPEGKPLRMSGTHTDITERKQAEEALRKSEQKYSLLFEQSATPASLTKFPELVFVDVNRALESLLGYARQEMQGKTILELGVADVAEQRRALAEFEKQGSLSRFETYFYHRSGQKLTVLLSANQLELDGHLYVFSTLHDITEHKRAEEALREREERLSQALRAARGGAWEWDIASNRVFWSDENYRLLGLDPQSGDTSYENWLNAVHPDDRAVAGAEVFKAVEAQRDLDIEFRVVWPDGTERWINDVGTFIFDKEGNPSRMYGVQIDITERKKAEETLRQSNHRLEETLSELKETQKQMMHQERLAAVGQMAAGIAHDFNNILATITLYSQTTMLTPGISQRDQERLLIINEQAWRASHLVQQILDFSRKAMLQMQPVHFLSLLQNQVDLLKRILPEHIKIQLISQSDGCVVKADQARMQQMITNLAMNARDAMPNGGSLDLELKQLHIEPGQTPPLPEMAPGDWLQLSVTDTGTGIAPEVLPHIFEPFFTTKGPGEGSGLGLAQVYGIVGQHSGHIDVETEEGTGTVFHIFLPTLKVSPAEPSAPKLPSFPHGRGELVLVVEDNITLREAMLDILAELDYQAVEAANGRQALKVLEEMGEQVSLVLSDVIMPEMGGKELCRTMKAREWLMPVVLLSGHTLDESANDMQDLDVAAWLLKPVSFESLANTLDGVLRK